MRSLYPGRFQPLHEGHKAIIQKLVSKGHTVIPAIRDTPITGDNPLSVAERYANFRRAYGDKLEIAVVPDFDQIVYGRGVGFDIVEVRLTPEEEAISATNIREPEITWLFGHKLSALSLAHIAKRDLTGIVLDLNAADSLMSGEVSPVLVATLARLLMAQGERVWVAGHDMRREDILAVNITATVNWVLIGDSEVESLDDMADLFIDTSKTVFQVDQMLALTKHCGVTK